jgi:ERCC4-type nuclease
MNLLVDDREFLVERCPELGPHRATRLTTGDYAIMHGELLIACIERKTLDDYGASLKDGRHANRGKMLEMRAKTGCRVYYIIEGRAAGPDACYGGIPYRYILSSIDHIMYRDGISVIFTRDPADTAARLCSLMANLGTLGEGLFAGIIGDIPDLAAQLAAKHEKTREEIINTLWSCFRGISMESAKFYTHWALADIIGGKIPRSDIATTKVNGRTISKGACSALCAIDKPTEVRLLSAIPGISRARAEAILSQISLRELIEKSPAEISALGGKKKISGAIVDGMLSIFASKNYA